MNLNWLNIPVELQERKQWVCSKRVAVTKKDGTPGTDKIPICPATGKAASSTDPSTWGTFEQAVASAQEWGQGIGYVFSLDDPFTGVDLDRVFEPELDMVIHRWAREALRGLDSYTEFSQSGTGLHVLVKAKKPGTECKELMGDKSAIEMYDHARYFDLTGNVYNGSQVIECRQAEIETLYSRVWPVKEEVTVKTATVATPAEDVGSKTDVLKRVASSGQSEAFLNLWTGDMGAYAGDHSAADLALLGMLHFWTGGNKALAFEMFGESGLARDKWTGREDYRERSWSKVNHGKVWKPQRAFWDYTPNDVGNSDLFRDRRGDDVRYSPGVGWLIWDGAGWRRGMGKDGVSSVENMQAELARGYEKEAMKSKGEPEERLARFKRAIALGTSARITPALTFVKAHPSIGVLPTELDKDPFVIGTANGVIDLRTGAFREGSREDLVTRRIGTAFDPAATCPTWERFLREIMQGDLEMVDYLQRAFGYMLTGSMVEQCFFFWYGVGANGKSKLRETLARLWGEYCKQASTTLLSYLPGQGKNPEVEIAELPGCRFLLVPEVAERASLNEALMKDITGGESLHGCAKYKDGMDFWPSCKIVVCGNHKPSIDGTDEGIWRRVRLIPFNARFEKGAPGTDEKMGEKLQAELPGILNWVIAGTQKWIKSGLPTPAKVMAAVTEYRESEDMLGGFISHYLVEQKLSQISKTEVFARYKLWCDLNGVRYPMNAHTLNKTLNGRGFTDGALPGKRSNHWRGYALVSEDKEVTVKNA